VASQLHDLIRPLHHIVNHTEIVTHDVCHELFYALIDSGVSDFLDVDHRDDLTFLGVVGVHRDEALLVGIYEDLFVVRLRPVFCVFSEVVPILEFLYGGLPLYHVHLLLQLLRGHQRVEGLILLELHAVEVDLGGVELAGVGAGVVVAVSHAAPKDHDLVERTVVDLVAEGLGRLGHHLMLILVAESVLDTVEVAEGILAFHRGPLGTVGEAGEPYSEIGHFGTILPQPVRWLDPLVFVHSIIALLDMLQRSFRSL
jgi:hypothetical protein